MKNNLNKSFYAVAFLALGVGALTLTSCGSKKEAEETNSDSYTIRIKNVEDYIAEDNEFPICFDKSEGANIFTYDAWSLEGTKVNIDDDGNAIGCYWDVTLNLEDMEGENIYSYYRLNLSYHAAHSDSYTVDLDASYSWEGIAYATTTGYHLFAPDYAEVWVVGQAMDQTAGWGAGDNSNANVQYSVGPDGSTVYKYYTNSNLEAAGFSFGFPFMSPLCSLMSECDVVAANGAITKFENVTDVRGNEYETVAGIDEDQVDEILGEHGLIDVAVESDNDIVHEWADATGDYKLSVTADGDVAKFTLTLPDSYEAYSEDEIANLTKDVDYVEEQGFFNRTYYYKLVNGEKVRTYKEAVATSSVYNKISGEYTVVFPGIGMMNADETVTMTFNSDGSLQLNSDHNFENTKFYLASTIAEGTDITKTEWTTSFDDGMGSQNPVTFSFKADGTLEMTVVTSTGSGTSTSVYVGTYENNNGVVTVKDVHNNDPEYALDGDNATKYYPSIGVWAQLETPISGVNKMGQTTTNSNSGYATIILLEDGSFVFGPAPVIE